MKIKISLVLIALALAISLAGLWYYQRNVYSKDVLKLELLAPDKVQAFDGIEYVVKYKNNGNVALEDVKLLFEYPSRSFPEADSGKIFAKKLDDIYPGQERTETFKARLFGAENQAQVAKVTISYSPKNLKAKYESKTSATTLISSVPLNLDLVLPSRAENAKPMSFTVNYSSTGNYPVSGVRLLMQYPSGFQFSGSKPRGIENNEWDIGLLNGRQGGSVNISGSLTGDLSQEKDFKAQLGVWVDGEFVLLKEIEKAISISQPDLLISQTINGTDNYIANPGDVLHYQVTFRNVGENYFDNLFLVVRLDGYPFDLSSVKTEDGQFQSGDNSIIWDSQRVPKLKFLNSGEEGSVEFWINLKNESALMTGDKNPSVKDTVVLSQTRQQFETKIQAKPVLTQSVYYTDNIFGNSGPIPPQVGQSTTYTVVWRIKPSYSDLGSVSIRAALPPKVSLVGKTFPQDAKLVVEASTDELLWDVGSVRAGSATDLGPSIAFQIMLKPESSDLGKTMPLISAARLLGADSWSGAEVAYDTSATIDTTLPDDSSLSNNSGLIR